MASTDNRNCSRPAGDAPLRHILCVYPYRRELKLGRFHPPLGLEIIAAALKPLCRSIDMVDLRYETGHTTDFIRPDTDAVCFSVNWESDDEFIRKEIRSVPGGPMVIVGGRHATQDPARLMVDCPNIGVLVRGDGEQTVKEIARGRPLAEIPGISHRANGSVVHNPHSKDAAPPSEDIRPDRSLRRYRYEVDIGGYGTGLRIDSVAGSRGCPFNCKFCSFSRNPWGTKRPWTPRSPKVIVDELAEIDAPYIMFTDDVFTHDMDRVDEICELILERGIRKKCVVNARLEVAKRPDVLRKMERAGFISLFLGVESAHDKTLRSMNKGFDTRRIEEYFAVLRKSSMIMHAYFIIGNIGETEEEMLEIAPFARRIGVDTLGLSRLRTNPYDGLAELISETPGYHVSRDGMVYSDAVSRARIKEIRRMIERRFYTARHVLRLAWKCLRGGALSPWLMARLAGSAIRASWSKRRARAAKGRRPRPQATATGN